MRFFLIDRITEINPGSTAKGLKAWSLDNEIFQDHFPGFPTVPGVLLTESMAQLSGILIEKSYYKEYGDKNPVYPVLSIIQKAKFRSFVRPGDQCIIESQLLSIDRGRANVEVKTFLNKEKVVDAQLSFVIGMTSDMDENPYLKRREQYYHSILPKS